MDDVYNFIFPSLLADVPMSQCPNCVERSGTASLKQQSIKLLYPAKKNMKTQNQVRSKSERCKLRKRYRIENMFGRIDKFKRLYTRRDRTICMFEALHHFAFCIMTFNQLLKMDM
jgi:hypothetical protein